MRIDVRHYFRHHAAAAYGWIDDATASFHRNAVHACRLT
jgi:hypothetical protein